MAGIAAARMGVDAMIVEETPWLGGMLTSAGVSAIDGCHRLPTGLWSEFRDSLRTWYGGPEAVETGWVSNTLFEPSVGQRILTNMALGEADRLSVVRQTEVSNPMKTRRGWTVTLTDADGRSRQVDCRVLIDATELGDVAKAAGVGYDVGMDARAATDEAIAADVAHNIVQDLTYVAILKEYDHDMTIPRPEGYDSTRFACSCLNAICSDPVEPNRLWSPESMITYGKLPNGKYMINWPAEGNDYYINLIEMTPAERDSALQAAKQHTLQFVYFIQKELGMNHLGLADDEYATADLLPYIPYHRESRRIHGVTRFTLNHAAKPYDQSKALYRTCVAVGDYPVDHHHKAYRGSEELPDLHFYPIPSYGLPAGVLIPEATDDMLVAEKSISVSNLINGTTRLQPVVMQIGQAAGTMAALAVKEDKQPREVSVRGLQRALLASGSYLLPYLDRQPTDADFAALQRIGSTGIMRGEGRNVGWRNETWFRADTLLTAADLAGWADYYPSVPVTAGSADAAVSVGQAMQLIADAAKAEGIAEADKALAQVASAYGLDLSDTQRPMLRGEMAVLIDGVLDPFAREVDWQGILQ